jgi:LysR family glycine cleavage system transcriptional activator
MVERRLPPLNALKAFEAAARHSSVKNAAEELRVTSGAVSQMVKALEADLGVTLFRRVNRGIFLTPAGQTYLPPIRNALRQILDATRRVAAAAEAGVLTVSLTPSFAAAWLVPRLNRFQEANPDIDLQIVTGKALVNFSRDDVDVAVRHGLGIYPGLRSDRVISVELVPVAAAELVERRGMPASAMDLMSWPLLHEPERQDWHLWFQAQGVHEIALPRGPTFDDSNLLLQAALAGQGAALLPSALIVGQETTGRVRRLSHIVWPERFAYYLVCQESQQDQRKIRAFREWILTEAAASR